MKTKKNTSGKGDRCRIADHAAFRAGMDRIRRNLRCPICGATVVLYAGYGVCSSYLAGRVPAVNLAAAKEIEFEDELPIAATYSRKGSKKPVDAIFRVAGRFYGRLQVNDGIHHDKEILARSELIDYKASTKSDVVTNWVMVRLSPFKVKEDSPWIS